jgi:hypothetical protein
MNEEALWDMSDEELEAAVKEAKANEDSPEIDDQLEEPFLETEETLDDETVEYEEELTSKEDEDGPEQPEDDNETLEDSGHDASDESDETDAADEDTLKTDEETADESSEEEDEEGSEEADDSEDKEQPTQEYKFRANGKDYEFSSKEIVDQFPKIFGQAMDYTKKMQAIKPWRKTIDAIEGAELSHEDVNLMIDVLKGDKEAITEVLKRTGTDTLDLDTEAAGNYVAKDYGRDDSALAVKDVIDDISQDVEYATTHSILSKDWDETSWQTMTKNPDMIKLLHTDVKSGMYSTLQPVAEKLKVFDGARKSDLDYYKEAAQEHYARVAQQEAYRKQETERLDKKADADAKKAKLAEVKANSEKRTATKEASVKRKAAAPTKTAAAGRAVIDYLEDSDEAFDEWYKKIQDDI